MSTNSNTESDGNPLSGLDMGLGAWSWGDRVVWQYGRGYGEDDAFQAFEVSLQEGIRLVDTAEIYGSGRSERLLGQFAKDSGDKILISTKAFPWPWRLSRRAFVSAIKSSLARLHRKSVDLYQIHHPSPFMSIERMMEAMVDCAEAGLTSAIGVSNCGEAEMLRAYSTLGRHRLALCSNQVHYSLMNRQVEKNGLLARCKELGVRLIAYSPLEMGLLAGKYGPGNPPPGNRATRFARLLNQIGPLLKLMTQLGQDHGGKSNAQVALNWVMAKGALPIPGAKNAKQAADNAGARGWTLTADEIQALDAESDLIG
jgi:aryl-alcohol dehydrogenase-like predicted oxidoreductase